MRRIWHPYMHWECYRNGMWKIVSAKERADLLPKAIEFTGNATLYGSYMQRVIIEWPITCEHHMTDVSTNRKAFVGHAATYLAIQCPEDITRHAWSYLTDQQRLDANAQADAAIAQWESMHAKEGSQLHFDLEETRLSA